MSNKKVKHVWVSEGGKNSCAECDSLDGQEFDSLEDVPPLPHPNCKCDVIEVSTDEEVVNISEPVDRASPANADDTMMVKIALAALGYYKAPKDGMSRVQDYEMFEAIKAFQKDNDLHVDGRIKPDGETLEKMNEIVSEDCTITNFIKHTIEVNKKSSAKSPVSTGNPAIDRYVGKSIPTIGNYNKGFSIGKAAFVLKQTYDDLCK